MSDASRWSVPPVAEPAPPAVPAGPPADAAAGSAGGPSKGGGRTHYVAVRLSDAEWAAWVAAAREAGRGKTAGWVRDVVNAHVAGRAVPGERSPVAEQLAGLRAELVRVGNNLNQATKAANTVGVDRATAAGVIEACADVAGQMRAVVAGLDRLREQP